MSTTTIPTPTSPGAAPLRCTPLYDLHVAAGAKMVPFAGYEMPVQYPLGVLKEHLWTREKAGLFDVSHMGQMAIAASDGKHETAARALEGLVPADILGLKPGQQRYSQLLADDGGILDDLMVTRPASDGEAGHIYVVVNASCKDADHAHMMARLPSTVRLVRGDDRALIALQGPVAADVIGASGAARLGFMQAGWFDIAGVRAHVSRSGYTGEDGFEISVSADAAVRLWSALAADPRVQPIGLGARDSLRLEAGLCLYGHDIDTTTSPIEAALGWSIQKRRRTEGGFPGAARIQRELASGPARVRVGIRPEGRAPAREGTEIQDATGQRIGVVTSGGFGPSVNAPVAMGYVSAAHAKAGTKLQLIVRGKPLPAEVAPMPFTPHRYAR
ncbi:MAG: glycine cleavage system aminomethyltransferase GcvT [Hyphomicrobiales bacterium]|nr:glycine cleavage system aminomethyltransferase GcvT [Hyphomicrobiales bacterium]